MKNTTAQAAFQKEQEMFLQFMIDEGETTLEYTLKLIMLSTKERDHLDKEDAGTIHWMAYFATTMVSLLNKKQYAA
jgi:hypothetical protein